MFVQIFFSSWWYWREFYPVWRTEVVLACWYLCYGIVFFSILFLQWLHQDLRNIHCKNRTSLIYMKRDTRDGKLQRRCSLNALCKVGKVWCIGQWTHIIVNPPSHVELLAPVLIFPFPVTSPVLQCLLRWFTSSTLSMIRTRPNTRHKMRLQSSERRRYGPMAWRTDGRTDGWTEGRTDTPSYRNATAHLKMRRRI